MEDSQAAAEVRVLRGELVAVRRELHQAQQLLHAATNWLLWSCEQGYTAERTVGGMREILLEDILSLSPNDEPRTWVPVPPPLPCFPCPDSLPAAVASPFAHAVEGSASMYSSSTSMADTFSGAACMGDELPRSDPIVDSFATDHSEDMECEPSWLPPPSPTEPDECGPTQLDDFDFPAW